GSCSRATMGATFVLGLIFVSSLPGWGEWAYGPRDVLPARPGASSSFIRLAKPSLLERPWRLWLRPRRPKTDHPSNSVTDTSRALARRWRIAREGFLLSPLSSFAMYVCVTLARPASVTWVSPFAPRSVLNIWPNLLPAIMTPGHIMSRPYC